MTERDPHWAERLRMIEEQLAARGVTAPRVLAALERVPRHRFVAEHLLGRAHSDRALPIDCDQTISQPYIVGAMTQALALRPTDRVLEIGTGSGYQTAVLAELAAAVYSIERIPELSRQAAERLAALGYRNVHLGVGDGSLGWPEQAPFDAIIVTAAAPEVPPALLAQLGEGGRLVAPVGTRDLQQLLVLTRRGEALDRQELCACTFVPLLGEQGWDG